MPVESKSLPVLHPVIIPPDAPNPTTLETQAQQFFTIQTKEQYESSGVILGKVKNAQAFFHNLFDKSIEAWNKGHKHELSIRNQFTKPLDYLETRIKSAQSSYSLEQIRKQREIADRNARIMREEAEREAREQIENLIEFGTPDAIEDAAKIQEKIETGTLEVSASPPMMIQVPKSGTGSSGRLVQKIIIKDVDKLKREYMIPDMELLSNLFSAMGVEQFRALEEMVGVGSIGLEDIVIMSQRRPNT